MAIKSFNEFHRGWGSCDREGRPVGFEGYTLSEAQHKRASVAAFMAEVRGIRDIRVSIEPMGNGKYQVVNTSTYER